MTNDQFPLTFKWKGEEGWWEAFCPEWQVAGRGSTKEDAKKALCRTILINARAILDVKNIHPTMEPPMKEVAQQVIDHKEELADLLRETVRKTSDE